MKLLVIFIASILILSCGDKKTSQGSGKPVKTYDSSLNVVLFHDTGTTVKVDFCAVITRDTTGLVKVDSSTYKAGRVIDLFYFSPFVDSVRDEKGNVIPATAAKGKTLQYKFMDRSKVIKDFGPVNKLIAEVEQKK